MRIAKPFRSFAGAGFDFISASSSISTSLEVEATLLRGDPTSFASNTPTRPLFQIDSTGNDATTAIAGTWNPHNPDRNPLFRYQGIERLANLVTTRSNVYAVWITMGYFQVTPNQGTGSGRRAPRRLSVGSRVGQRHRRDRAAPGLLYLRSHHSRRLPAGQDTNIEKGMLLRRYIE